MRKLNDDIERYRKGKLSAAEMHALEKEALSDRFLADALDGVSSIQPHELTDDLAELNKKISTKKPGTLALRIAASILLLISVGAVVYLTNDGLNNDHLALNKESVLQPEDKLLSDSASSPLPDQTKSRQPQKELLVQNEVRKNEADKTSAKPAAAPVISGAGAKKVSDDEKDTELLVAEEAEISDLIDENLAEKKDAIAGAGELRRESLSNSTDLSRTRSAPTAAKGFAADIEKRTVTGTVKASEDGLPLPGVNVFEKGTKNGTITDMKGQYTLAISNSDNQIVFSFVGLQNIEINSTDPASFNVRMKEDVSLLSEVVVTGYSDNDPGIPVREPVLKLAEPFGGRKAYDEYLERNLQYPQQALQQKVKGKVTIQFTVDRNGNTNEFKVLKSLGYGCDDEVIRLVKEGPPWSPTTEDDVPVVSSVRVKMKFDPAKAAAK